MVDWTIRLELILGLLQVLRDGLGAGPRVIARRTLVSGLVNLGGAGSCRDNAGE